MSFYTCVTDACSKIKGYMNNTYSYMRNALTYKDRALEAERKAELAQHRAENAKDIAVSAVADLEGCVIPTNATYSKNEIDENFATIALAIWENTARNSNIRLKDFN